MDIYARIKSFSAKPAGDEYEVAPLETSISLEALCSPEEMAALAALGRRKLSIRLAPVLPRMNETYQPGLALGDAVREFRDGLADAGLSATVTAAGRTVDVATGEIVEEDGD